MGDGVAELVVGVDDHVLVGVSWNQDLNLNARSHLV
jgi:hypothetical protein